MTELFDSYASDFTQLVQSITSKLSDATSQTGESRNSTLRRADMESEEADEILAQMDIEVQGFPTSIRSRYAVQLRTHRAQLEKLKKSVHTQSQAAPGGRGDYGGGFADSGGDLESGTAGSDAPAQRQRLLQGTATLEDGSRRLEESHRLALQTEDLGADILTNLRGQREQIENSRDTLRQADSNIDRSSRTLQQMIRRARQQKLTMGAILAVLVLLILLILYSKFT